MSIFSRGVEQAAGAPFWITKTIANNLITTAGVDLVAAAGEAYEVDDVLVESDAGTITTATNIQLVTGALGVRTFFETAISGLGGSKVKDLRSASVSGVKCVVGLAETIAVKATGANAAGTGNTTFRFLCRRLTSSGNVPAAAA